MSDPAKTVQLTAQPTVRHEPVVQPEMMTVRYEQAPTVNIPPQQLRELLMHAGGDPERTLGLPLKPSDTVTVPGPLPTMMRLAPAGEWAGQTRLSPATVIKASSTLQLAPIDIRRHRASADGGSVQTLLHKTLSLVLPGALRTAPETAIGRFLRSTIADRVRSPEEQQPSLPALSAVQQHAFAREVPFLTGLPDEELFGALERHELQLVDHERDLLLDLKRWALLILAGQVALGRFTAKTLAAELTAQRDELKAAEGSAGKKARLRRQKAGPLFRMTTANLATFTTGELALLADQHGEVEFALYTVTPIRGLQIAQATLERWSTTYPFFHDRLRRALQHGQTRATHQDGGRALVADFFVRHGMSVALTLRVRDLDRCVECMACEVACAERYGVKRLSLHGRLLGRVDFVDCCHTCVDQRCIDPCTFDAIRFDRDKKEILIDEAACTGCTLCATACPYNAIEMHELDEQPLLKLRLQREDKLRHGPDAPRRAPLRRIASKCDHCVSYPDQACLSACPTGALLEIDPKAAFVERTQSMSQAVAQGFQVTVRGEPALFLPDALLDGFQPAHSQGRVAPRWLRGRMLWSIGLPALLLILGELVLRRYLPEYSGQYAYLTRAQNLDREMALANVGYGPGSALALVLGWIGVLLLSSSALGLLGNRITRRYHADARQNWYTLHIWASTVGSGCILLHTAAKLDNWVSIPVWLMVATSLSGVVGRYLRTGASSQCAEPDLRLLSVHQQLVRLAEQQRELVPALNYCAELGQQYQRANETGHMGALIAILTRELWQNWLRLPSLLLGEGSPHLRDQARALVRQHLRLQRKRALVSLLSTTLKGWRWLHLATAVAFAALAVLHIVLQLVHPAIQ